MRRSWVWIVSDARVIQDGERFVLDHLKTVLPTDKPIIFDVGANVGDYTNEVFMRMRYAQVTCFEPQQDAITELAQRAKKGHWGVRIEQLALSNVKGVLSFQATQKGCCYLAGAHRIYDAPSDQHLDRMFDVIAVTLDDFCWSNGIGRINLLKLDVEGHEPFVLSGAMKMLEQGGIDVIQFEMSDVAAMAGWTFEDMWFFLKERDFEIFLEKSDKLQRIPKLTNKFDNLQDYVNMIAVAPTCDWWQNA